MEKQVKYNCIQDLKKDGSPIIIVAALYEAEETKGKKDE